MAHIKGRVTELADFCKTFNEYKLKLSKSWDAMLTTVRVNNPRFLEKSYQDALDYAYHCLR